MLELLVIYQWTIVAGMLAACALSILGCHVAARDKSMQTLCIGQGAMLGVLVGIGMQGYDHYSSSSEWSIHSLPFILAVGVSLLIGYIGVVLERRPFASKTTYFIGLFTLLLSANQMVSAVMPGLEAHMAQVFFGDLATLSSADINVTIFASALVLALQVCFRNALLNRSFSLAIIGRSAAELTLNWSARLSEVLSFLFICFAVQYLGFLFTISAIFLPTIAMSLSGIVGFRAHLRGVVLIGLIGTCAGFMLSLWQTQLPTVPTIALCLSALGLACSGLRVLRREI